MSRNYMLQFFEYAHLPHHLQEISKPFARLAEHVSLGPANPETQTALRKLLEAKDCAVRAVLFKAEAAPATTAAPRPAGEGGRAAGGAPALGRVVRAGLYRPARA